MIDLNDIAMFIQVVRSGSFAEAARRLGMPPNTVSRRIQRLESALGARLLQRTTRKLTLTGAGETFHARCADAIDGLAVAGRALVLDGQEPVGSVRVAAPADFFDFFPMAWVADFLHLHRRLHLDFVLSDSRADLIAERIDVAFRGGPSHDSGYIGRELLRAQSDGLVASPSYLAARGVPSTPHELAQHDCVTPTHPSGRASWRLTGPDGAIDEFFVTGRFSGNTAQSLRRAAIAGLGIALLPTSLTRLDVEAGRLTPVLVSHRRTGQSLSVLYPSRRQLPLAVSTFIGFVIERLSQSGTLPDALRE